VALRAQLVVDDDVAATLDFDTGLVKVQVVAVGPATHRIQHVRFGDRSRTIALETSKPLPRLVNRTLLASRITSMPSASKNLPSCGGDIRVLVWNRPRRLLGHRDVRTKPTIHPGEL